MAGLDLWIFYGGFSLNNVDVKGIGGPVKDVMTIF